MKSKDGKLMEEIIREWENKELLDLNEYIDGFNPDYYILADPGTAFAKRVSKDVEEILALEPETKISGTDFFHGHVLGEPNGNPASFSVEKLLEGDFDILYHTQERMGPKYSDEAMKRVINRILTRPKGIAKEPEYEKFLSASLSNRYLRRNFISTPNDGPRLLFPAALDLYVPGEELHCGVYDDDLNKKYMVFFTFRKNVNRDLEVFIPDYFSDQKKYDL